ncbi:MAG: UrcA family protein [Pseudomonadota bacterium]|nr:UrcA family protein [Pseudomonadota bacterium]
MKALTATLAAVSLGVVATATPAIAGEQKTLTSAVKIADLNLETAEGQKTLDRRLRHAARKVCQMNQASTGSRARIADANTCYNKAMTSAKRQVATLVENTRVGG